jgi:hypothetical protein
MSKYLDMIPKNLLAFLAIAGGILFIVISQPPHTICDSQLETLNGSQRRFLFKDPKSKQITSTRYQQLREVCMNTNTPGGCYELFQDLKTMLHDLSILPKQCAPQVADVKEFRMALWDSAALLVKLAWGETPPSTYASKFGWLDTADLALFCRLWDRIAVIYPENDWAVFRDKMMVELPGAKDLSRNSVWDLSLFSISCSRYP